MVKLNKIYTKTGDDGTTGLSDGSRVKKYDLRPSAYGTIDELNSVLGLIISYIEEKKDFINCDYKYEISLLKKIQNDLFDIGADLSTPINNKEQKNDLRILESQVLGLERSIDKYNKYLLPLKSFILPGGSMISAWTHLARTIARRAEREIVKLSDEEEINKFSLIYLNRLSDLLFVMCRFFNNKGQNDVLWQPGQNR